MCGIAGITGVDQAAATAFLEAATAKLKHRGPDASGTYSNNEFGVHFVHRRLSVIDTSAAANQPMVSACGRYVITYNGEIYNYKQLREEPACRSTAWRTASDTEVLLELFAKRGAACLKDIQGMFAFAVFDKKDGVLTLGRDRVGEKPLYYAATQGGFSFASELTTLILDRRIERVLDEQAGRDYLAYGYVPGARTLIDKVLRVLPGHYVQIKVMKQEAVSSRYWEVPKCQYAGESLEELTDGLEEKLETSIRRQLVADVPVGVLLSGGVDSSLVAAIGSRVSNNRLKTFSVVFPGHEQLDESVYARDVAVACGTEHHEIVGTNVSVDMIEEFVSKCDEPLADQSFFATLLLSEAVSREVTVALGGDGADELFGGYPQYQWYEKTAMLRKVVPSRLRRTARAILERLLPIGLRGRNGAMACLADPDQTHSFINTFFDRLQQDSLLAGKYSGEITQLHGLASTNGADAATRVTSEALMRTDFASFLPGDILMKVDRSAMAASLEVRAPWLDSEVLDFAFGKVPCSMKATANESKILPKLLLKKVIDVKIDQGKKRGFFVPIDEWMRGPWKNQMTEIFTDMNTGIFNKQYMRDLFRKQVKGARLGSRLFSVLVLILWCEKFNVRAR